MCPQLSHTLTANCTEYSGPCGVPWRARSTSSVPPTRRGCGHPSGVMSLPLPGVGRFDSGVYPGGPACQRNGAVLEAARTAKDIPKPQIAKTQSRIRVELLVDSARRLRTQRCSVATPPWAKDRFPSCRHFLPEFPHSPKSLQRTAVIGSALRRRL
jgi:hypothetical protein